MGGATDDFERTEATHEWKAPAPRKSLATREGIIKAVPYKEISADNIVANMENMQSTMMLPYVVTLIPTFLIWRDLQLINTYDPLVIGSLFAGGPFFIFLMRQFMLTLPVEMEGAARIDGANTAQVFARIVLPLVKPALLAVGIFSFQGAWNDFLAPLIHLNDIPKYTLTLGMCFFVGGANEAPKWHWLMAMSTIIALPILAIFFLAQRQFIEGITLTGLKG